MSGYGHEGDERTFAALPPARGAAFARTWWGLAWLKALEDTALDGQQLKAGRRHARAGAVGAVSVRPGRITAVVKDRDGTAHRSDVLVREFSEEEWERLLDLAVDSAGHIAALLDREMPPHLVEDAAVAGLDLLPGIGDLDPECGCEAWDHCPHTSALCYQVARLLDEDPFVLLLMRGRGERTLLDQLQARSAARAAHGGRGADDTPGADAAEGAGGMPGVSAEEAYAAGFLVPPLPAPPVAQDAPGRSPSLDTETEPEPGVEPAALEFLASDAADRAHRMLVEALADGASAGGAAGGASVHGGSPVPATPTAPMAPMAPAALTALTAPAAPAAPATSAASTASAASLTVAQDAVRLGWESPVPWITARLASGSGRTRAEMDLATRAWGFGGAAALAVLEEEWTPDSEALAWAGTRLTEAWEDDERPVLRRSGGARWTVVGGEAQLRLGEDGRWWPYLKSGARWSPAGPADRDPATALATAFAAGPTGAGG
ncbi:SWF or SNF family helicase [Streptomyces sp. TX20-6-3]|uniref:SWIM zinc finger family protein n=1 Tax=Streptomyces sp. TX20-6-3 TaxID=3028705 RepID=UPI0029A740F3|nr:SWF or SNF family helicase [Streptomyces sp. TX20-6-3]MDX2563027.1 SWF or SNF family helicase [Streptomyces sp. TX20-6-3]